MPVNIPYEAEIAIRDSRCIVSGSFFRVEGSGLINQIWSARRSRLTGWNPELVFLAVVLITSTNLTVGSSNSSIFGTLSAI